MNPGPVHMDNSCLAFICLRGTLDSGTGIYPWCVSWLFGANSLWWDTLLRLDAMVRVFVLSQLDMSDIVDSPWEALLFLRSGWC